MSTKIGLVTFFSNNYGSALQCYATKKFLQKNGCECDVLYEYSYGYEKLESRIKYLSKIALCSLLYRDFAKNRKEIKRSERKAALSKKSKFRIDWFCETVLQPKGLEYNLLNDLLMHTIFLLLAVIRYGAAVIWCDRLCSWSSLLMKRRLHYAQALV